MDAFFYIDKPTGMTSFGVLRDMRRILGIKKLGHTGTLDPLATGGLLVATGNYTKLIPYFEKDAKSYRATIMLDGTSDSYDSDTQVRYISQQQQEYFRDNISLSEVEKIFSEHFFGKITQIPPKYSALKIDGKRALDRVKAGEEIEMKSREVEIYSYKLISFAYPKLVVELSVSAGTYIRSIAYDLGLILGTGAYLTALKRTGVGILGEGDMKQLAEISSESHIDIHHIFPKLVYEFHEDSIYKRLMDGQRVPGNFELPEGQNILLMSQGVIRFIVEYKDGVLHPRKKIT